MFTNKETPKDIKVVKTKLIQCKHYCVLLFTSTFCMDQCLYHIYIYSYYEISPCLDNFT